MKEARPNPTHEFRGESHLVSVSRIVHLSDIRLIISNTVIETSLLIKLNCILAMRCGRSGTELNAAQLIVEEIRFGRERPMIAGRSLCSGPFLRPRSGNWEMEHMKTSTKFLGIRIVAGAMVSGLIALSAPAHAGG